MVLDASVAGIAANSYVTVAEADAIAETDPTSGEAWLHATLEEKETHLIAATDDVDLYRRTGLRYTTTQALLFPRDIDWVGDPAVAFLPYDVKRATYEQAVYLQQNAHLIRDAASHRASGLLNSADDDGSWTAAMSPTFPLYAPKMTERLDRLGARARTGRYLVSVPIGSSFPP